jgi:hypothetical protein
MIYLHRLLILHLFAAKATFAQSKLNADQVIMVEALALLERDDLPTSEAQQLKWTVCNRYKWARELRGGGEHLKPEEAARIKTMTDELVKNTAVRKDALDEAMADAVTGIYMCMQYPFAWNGGRVMTDDVIYDAMSYTFTGGFYSHMKRAVEQAIGARREWLEMTKNTFCPCPINPAACHTTKKNVAYVRAATDAEWGEDNEKCMDSLLCFNFKRHHEIGRSTPLQISLIFYVRPCYIAEKSGNVQQLLDLFNHHCQYAEAYISAIEPFSADSNYEEWHW